MLGFRHGYIFVKKPVLLVRLKCRTACQMWQKLHYIFKTICVALKYTVTIVKLIILEVRRCVRLFNITIVKYNIHNRPQMEAGL